MSFIQTLIKGFSLFICAAPGLAICHTPHSIDIPSPFGDPKARFVLDYLGELSLPWDTYFDGTPFGGISGLDYDPASGHYFAISDDRARKGPARCYELAIDIDQQGIHKVTVLRTIVLKNEQGLPFARYSVDPEALRIGAQGELYWTSEGDARHGLPTVVRVSDNNGQLLRTFTTPEKFAPSATRRSGIRNNLALEGFTLLPSGDAIAGMETALYQDGPKASLISGSLARFIRYDPTTGSAKAEYVYPVSPTPQPPLVAPMSSNNGVSEVMALDDHRLLVIERGYASGFGASIKVFMADLTGATDVADMASLASPSRYIIPMRKSLLIDFRALGLTPDNLEAVTLGKTEDGSEVLIFAADDNFSRQQKNQFYAFKVVQRPTAE